MLRICNKFGILPLQIFNFQDLKKTSGQKSQNPLQS